MIYQAPLNSNVYWFCITIIEMHMKFQIEICNYNKLHTHVSYLLCFNGPHGSQVAK